jgi:hypothetical protein
VDRRADGVSVGQHMRAHETHVALVVAIEELLADLDVKKAMREVVKRLRQGGSLRSLWRRPGPGRSDGPTRPGQLLRRLHQLAAEYSVGALHS